MLKEVLSLFVNGLGTIHGEILDFIIKYSGGVIDSNYQREYERLFNTLRKRIPYEELILYNEYNNLN